MCLCVVVLSQWIPIFHSHPTTIFYSLHNGEWKIDFGNTRPKSNTISFLLAGYRSVLEKGLACVPMYKGIISSLFQCITHEGWNSYLYGRSREWMYERAINPYKSIWRLCKIGSRAMWGCRRNWWLAFSQCSSFPSSDNRIGVLSFSHAAKHCYIY